MRRKLGVITTVLAVAISLAPAAHANIYTAPGMPITVDHGDGTASRCTVGPLVVLPAGDQAILTSGHCGENGDHVNFTLPNSTIPASQLDRRVDQRIDGILHDYGLISVFPGSVSPMIGGRYFQEGFLRMEEIDVLRRQPGGLEVCSVGITSGERCGPVVKVDFSEGEIVADFDSAKGDSGGPVFVKNGDTSALVVGILMGYRLDATKDSVIIPIELTMNTYGLTIAR